MRPVRLLAAVALALATLLGLPARSEAAGGVYACTDAGNVWVVVDYKGSIIQGCATSPTSGVDALRQVTSYEVANGMISRIGGNPATINPNPYIYWNYFHKTPSGSGWGAWSYSSLGAGAYVPKPGSIEGWAYGATGIAVGWSPPARPVATTAAPAPTTQQPPATTQAPVQPAPPGTTTAPATTARTTAGAAAPTAPVAKATTAATTARTTAAVTGAGSAPMTAAAETATAAPTSADAAPTATVTPTEVSASAETPSAATSATSAAASPSTLNAGTTPQVSPPTAAPTRGSPVATMVTLAVLGAAAVGGAGWWLVRRRATP